MTPRPRDLLLHPASLVAIALLVINDHWLKSAWPSWWTGKLSDFAGLTFFPLLLATALDAITWRRIAPRTLVIAAAAATAVGFALVKTLPAATDVFRWAIGAAVTDPTDLLAVPFALIPVVLVMRIRVDLTRRVADPHAGERAGQHG